MYNKESRANRADNKVDNDIDDRNKDDVPNIHYFFFLVGVVWYYFYWIMYFFTLLPEIREWVTVAVVVR